MKIEKKTTMSKNKIEYQLKSAIDQLTPNVLDHIDLSLPQEPISTENNVIKIQRRLRPVFAAACFALLIMVTGGGYVYRENKVVSVVDLDINPSLEFHLNYHQKVLKVNAINDDAKQIIDQNILKGQKFENAVDQVIETMLDNGYLQEESSAVLVSVTPVSNKKPDELDTLVLNNVQESLKGHEVNAVIYNQTIEVSEDIKILAQEYNISTGKANFLKEMIEESNTLSVESMEELSALKISELSEGIDAGIYTLGDNITVINAQAARDPIILTESEEETTKRLPLEETSAIESSEEISPEVENDNLYKETQSRKRDTVTVSRETISPNESTEEIVAASEAETMEDDTVAATPSDAKKSESIKLPNFRHKRMYYGDLEINEEDVFESDSQNNEEILESSSTNADEIPLESDGCEGINTN